MKKNIPTIVLVLIFVSGLSLLLYPSLSNYWNSMHQTRVVSSYMEAVAEMDDETYQQILQSARKYNEELYKRGSVWKLNKETLERYNQELNIAGIGVMGYVDIPKLKCKQPIYHGTDEGALQVGIGHIEGSSLPVGGENTHCVISGHRGLPSARLFTDLDKLTEGDIFMLQILDETLTYEVKKIQIILPNEVGSLKMEPGKDICTLVTCTPYGINSHRLLVKGYRTENAPKNTRVAADAIQVEPLVVMPFLAVIPISVMIILLFINSKKGVKGHE